MESASPPRTTLGFAALVTAHGDNWRREASKTFGAENIGTPEQRTARAIVLSDDPLSPDTYDFLLMRCGRGVA